MALPDLDWFRNPPKSARPMVRWWWPGMDVEKDELLREVAEMDEAGLGGAEIQVFGVGQPRKLEKRDPERHKRIHRFNQPYYYLMVRAVLDEAAARDMVIDVTVCSSWPAGGVHIGKSDSLKTLTMATKVLSGSRRYRGRVPRPRRSPLPKIGKLLGLEFLFHEADPADLDIVKVLAVRPRGQPGKVAKLPPKRTTWLDPYSAIDLTDRVTPEGGVEWDVPEGTWQLFAIYGGPSGASPLMDAREDPAGNSLVVDHYAREPVLDHLNHHLGRGLEYWADHVGTTLRGFFTDSLELSVEWAWTDWFLQEFEDRRGYDLTPYLPACYVPVRDSKYLTILNRLLLRRELRPCFDFADGKELPADLGRRVRSDYERTVSDLFTEQFVKAMGIWAEENRLLSRIQAYGVRADTLKAYGMSHIPETEQLYAGGVRDFLRLAGSAGLLHGSPIVTAESIIFKDRDYLTTPLKWKVAADRLFVSGINQLIYHAFPYKRPQDTYPGTNPWASPHSPSLGGPVMAFSADFSRVNTFWRFLPLINGYVTRCQSVMQRGVTGCDLGMFYSLLNYPDAQVVDEELTGGYLDEFDAPLPKRPLYGRASDRLDEEERWTKRFIETADHLQSHGYSYAHVNPHSLLSGQVEDGRLVIGQARLKALILPDVERIDVEVAAKLKEIADAGIPVVFLRQVPDRQPGYLNWGENDASVMQLCERVAGRLESLVKTPDQLIEYLARRGVEPGVAFDQLQPTIHYIHKHADDADYYFVRSARREPSVVSVTFPHPDCVPYLLDPWTGDVTEAALYEQTGDGVRMELAFPSYGSTLVALRPGQPSRHVRETDLPLTREGVVIRARSPGAGTFSLTLSNGRRWKAEVEDDPPPAITLRTWRLDAALRGYDGQMTPISLGLDALVDWVETEELMYCSSRGTYTSSFVLEGRYLADGLAVELDLGRVHDVAEIEINGHKLPPLLIFPFSADVTPHLRAGQNQVKVTVTPALRNRLVGYGNAGIKACRQFRKRELSPSGLIGPVTLTPAWCIRLPID